MEYYKEIKFPTAIKNFKPIHDSQSTVVKITRLTVEDLNKEFVDVYTSIFGEIGQLLLFSTAPLSFGPIHIDHLSKNEGWGLNEVFSGFNSKMIWYEYDETKASPPQVTPANTTYLFFKRGSIPEITSHVLKCPTIVRTGYPHNIYNLSNEIRWCLSIRAKTLMGYNTAISLLPPELIVK